MIPGITIDKGIILLDRVALLYPGDLLHKGRHLAIIPVAERKWLNNSLISERENAPEEEMMAIAWSYAVWLHLKIEPEFVFHEQGYKGGAQSILDNFKEGRYFGVPMLVYHNLCNAPEKGGYPVMKKWCL